MPRSEGMDQEVADAINMTLMCKDLHVLPRAGGLLDQDAKHVWIMGIVSNAFDEKTRMQTARERALKGGRNGT